jgi:hypothetical protein
MTPRIFRRRGVSEWLALRSVRFQFALQVKNLGDRETARNAEKSAGRPEMKYRKSAG